MVSGEQFLSYAQHERALVHAPNDREVLGPNPIETLRCPVCRVGLVGYFDSFPFSRVGDSLAVADFLPHTIESGQSAAMTSLRDR
jgi:hypothetical protein